MVNLFTAGDKHFYKYIEEVKKQTGINLNLWGYSPFEVTHFKSGFLGYPPDFEMDRIYSHGILKQLKYQYLRAKAISCLTSITHYGIQYQESFIEVLKKKRTIFIYMTIGPGMKN